SGGAGDALFGNVYVTPSLLAGLGISRRGRMHGRSFWPLLQHVSYTPRTEVFAEKTFHTYYEPMRAIRTDRHKLIVNFEVSTRVDVPPGIRESPIYPLMLSELDGVRPPVELYGLEADAWERNNLAGQPEHASTESDLRGRL